MINVARTTPIPTLSTAFSPATPRTFAWRQARGGTAKRMAGAVLCSKPETGSRTVAAYAGHRGAPMLKLRVQSVKRAAQWVQTGV